MEKRKTKQNKEIHSKIDLRIRYSGIFVANFCMLARGKKKLKWEYFVTNSLIFKNKIHQLFKERQF